VPLEEIHTLAVMLSCLYVHDLAPTDIILSCSFEHTFVIYRFGSYAQSHLLIECTHQWYAHNLSERHNNGFYRTELSPSRGKVIVLWRIRLPQLARFLARLEVNEV